MIIYCSKTLQTALKLNKTDLATPEQIAAEKNPFYAWHGHIAKVDGRNTIVLMNDKTMEPGNRLSMMLLVFVWQPLRTEPIRNIPLTATTS
jgi:hypothetical protein